jgi:hypothetical protein
MIRSTWLACLALLAAPAHAGIPSIPSVDAPELAAGIFREQRGARILIAGDGEVIPEQFRAARIVQGIPERKQVLLPGPLEALLGFRKGRRVSHLLLSGRWSSCPSCRARASGRRDQAFGSIGALQPSGRWRTMSPLSR